MKLTEQIKEEYKRRAEEMNQSITNTKPKKVKIWASSKAEQEADRYNLSPEKIKEVLEKEDAYVIRTADVYLANQKATEVDSSLNLQLGLTQTQVYAPEATAEEDPQATQLLSDYDDELEEELEEED